MRGLSRLRSGGSASSATWRSAWLAEGRDLGGGVRVELLPAGAWITAPGAPRVADAYRKWLVGGLAREPEYPRVVIGHPGPAAVPLDAIAEFWSVLDETVRPVVRFAGFGVTEPPGGALGQALADRFGVPVVAGTGVPVLAPSGSGGPRVRTLLAGGAMHWRPYVWDVRYFPQAVDGSRGARLRSQPELVGHRRPIEGLAEIAPGVYEYADGAVLEVTPSGLMMRPAGGSAHAAAVRGEGPQPDRVRVFHAADASADADRMRELAVEAVLRLEAEVRERCEVLPSTALASVAGENPATASAVTESELEAGTEADVVAEPTAVIDPDQETEPESDSESVPELVTVADPDVEAGSAPAPAFTGPSPLLSIRLESGPPGLDLPAAAGAPGTNQPTAAAGSTTAPGTPGSTAQPPAPTPLSVPTVSEVRAPVAQEAPVKTAVPAVPNPAPAMSPPRSPAPPAPPASQGSPSAPPPSAPRTPGRPAPRVQPVPRPETSAVLPERALDKERQWLRNTLSDQYDATVGSVSRVLSEAPGLRTAGSSTADTLVDLVAVHLYLAGQTRPFDDLVRSATAGPHVPLARCIASGLRRLPSHRGAALIRTTLTEQELAWYEGRGTVTEWAFAPALAAGRFRWPGGVDLLIWSMTARRTHLLAPDLPEQVVFLPGTGFKVLGVEPGDRPRVLLRELAASETREAAGSGRGPLDDVALAGLAEAAELWLGDGEGVADLPSAWADRFGGAPGLIVRPGAGKQGVVRKGDS